MKTAAALILFFLFLPPLLPAEDPSWTDTLLDRVSEIDSRFYGTAAERLELWEGEGEEPDISGGALGPLEIFTHALHDNRELALLNIEKNKILIQQRGARARRFPTVDLEVRTGLV